MPLISKAYVEQNRQLHAVEPYYGINAGKFRDFVHGLIKVEKYDTVLDYGCGKGVLKVLLEDIPEIKAMSHIYEYDPAIEGKDAPPSPAELVCCFDVLEHVEPEHMNAVLRHLQSLTKQKLAFNISTRPSAKFLPDGRNSHVSLHDAAWWRRKMLAYFQIVSWNVAGDMVYGEALPIRGAVLSEHTLANRKRRGMPPQMRALFEIVKENSAKYADEIHRIKTIEMWEGHHDKPADMVVAVNILEHCADIEAALNDMCRLARLSVMVCMPEPKNLEMWRGIFERRLRVVDWMVDNGGLVMCGSPMVGVQGVKGIGAVDESERWEQVAWSVPRYPKRIQPAPAHGRTAILACYGPSIRDMVQVIKDEMALGNSDIITVSGAHDFIVENGLKQKYHIECDPRLHKADNIDHAVEGIEYLIASTCHKGYFEKLSRGGADVRLWHVATPGHATKLVDELGESSNHCISGGGSVGLRALPLLYTMGYRDFAIFGMDSSFRDDGNEQWAGKHAGKKQDVVECDCGGRIFKTSPILLTYATSFFEHIQKTRDCKYRVYGDSLLAGMCAMYAAMPEYQDLSAQAA
jgi:Protein of unknown function DUF115